jgi:DNA mismatch repair ATPase MutS
VSLVCVSHLATVKERGFFHPLDRNFQTIPNKFTSSGTTKALSDYLALCALAEAKAEEMMRGLCQLLYRDVSTIVQSSHCAAIFQCAYEHTASSIQRNWNLPTMVPRTAASRTFRAEGLFPYWMDHLSAVKNDLQMDEIILLTAPNMAGRTLPSLRLDV